MKQIATLGLVVPMILCLGGAPAMAANLEGCVPTTEKPCCCPDDPVTYTCSGCPPGWYQKRTQNSGLVCAPISGYINDIPSDTKGYLYAAVCSDQQCYTAYTQAAAAARPDGGASCFCITFGS